MKKTLIIGAISLATAVTLINTTDKGRILAARWLMTESTLRDFDLPEKTQWRPEGARRVSSNPNINARQAMFGRALHTDTHGSDEVGAVMAPAFELAWHAEPNLFVSEGPVFDSAGNIYFSPIFPPEDVVVVSLEPKTGKRRWVLKGFGAGAGTPLVIQDPDTEEDIVVQGSYDRATAMTPAGDILWDVATGLPQVNRDNISVDKHSYGINYHIHSDSLIAVMGDGHMYMLDRKTGAPLLDKPFMLPGHRLPVTSFSLPEAISRKANADIKHMTASHFDDQSPVDAVLHGAAGELQKVTNFFSIDSNTGRIWVAATLPDEADGKVDGWSEKAAVYGIDPIQQDNGYRFEINVVAKVPGGTSSTPAISADGKRIYVADAYDSVYAIDSDTGEHIWKFNVGDKVTGSIDVSVDNGEIFANTRNDIKKLFDRGDHAELGWTANMDMYKPGRFQRNLKSIGAEIGANGIAFVGASGFVAGNKKFPLKLGVGLLDRETGNLRYFAGGAEDSVSSMVSGPKGELYVGNSPLRRVLGRVILGEDKSPQAVIGGISQFKSIHSHLLMRDALWAAATRAENAATLVTSHPDAVTADIIQIKGLIQQARSVADDAINEGNLDTDNWLEIDGELTSIMVQLSATPETLNVAFKRLSRLADKLDTL